MATVSYGMKFQGFPIQCRDGLELSALATFHLVAGCGQLLESYGPGQWSLFVFFRKYEQANQAAMAYAKHYGHTIEDRTTNSILVIVLPRSFAQAMVDGESGFTGYLPAAPDTPILIVCESFRVFSLDRLAMCVHHAFPTQATLDAAGGGEAARQALIAAGH